MAAISLQMFDEENAGLEISIHKLSVALQIDNIDSIVGVLVSARLMRKAAKTQAVSFAHRRFNEYFLISRWLSGEGEAPLEAIPTDSRYRDALVLYAEVARLDDATPIAEFCWKEIAPFDLDTISSDGGAEKSLRMIHSLRFLSEAFPGRPDAMESIQSVLSEKIVMLFRNCSGGWRFG